MVNGQAGKGDKYRPTNMKAYGEGWDRIFGKKKSKYKAESCWVDGFLFHSRAEARYYGELKIKLRAGLIREFKRQTAFELKDSNGRTAGRHKVDFLVLTDAGLWEVHEVKGFQSSDWRLRRALFIATYPEIPYRTFKPVGDNFVEIMKP